MRQLISSFNEETLEIKAGGSPFAPSKNFIKVRNRLWDSLKESSSKGKFKFWNGSIYRLSKIIRRKKKNVIYINTIDFKTHHATAYCTDTLKTTPLFKRPNGMYVGGYIETSDEKLVFGQKAQGTMASKEINFIGGSLNKNEMKITSTEDLFNYFVKEFEEELGLSKKSIRKLKGLGIFVSDNFRIAVVFLCYLNLAQKEVLNNSSLNFENKKLIFFSKDELSKSINNPKINPNIQGTFGYVYNYL